MVCYGLKQIKSIRNRRYRFFGEKTESIYDCVTKKFCVHWQFFGAPVCIFRRRSLKNFVNVFVEIPPAFIYARNSRQSGAVERQARYQYRRQKSLEAQLPQVVKAYRFYRDGSSARPRDSVFGGLKDIYGMKITNTKGMRHEYFVYE